MNRYLLITILGLALISCNDSNTSNDDEKLKIGKPVNLSEFSIPYKMNSFHGSALDQYFDAHAMEQNEYEIYPEGIRRKDTWVQYPVVKTKGIGGWSGWLSIDTLNHSFEGIR